MSVLDTDAAPRAERDLRREFVLVIVVGLACVAFAPLGVPAALYGAYRHWRRARSVAIWLLFFAVVGAVVFGSLFVPNLGGGGTVGPATPAG